MEPNTHAEDTLQAALAREAALKRQLASKDVDINNLRSQVGRAELERNTAIQDRNEARRQRDALRGERDQLAAALSDAETRFGVSLFVNGLQALAHLARSR